MPKFADLLAKYTGTSAVAEFVKHEKEGKKPVKVVREEKGYHIFRHDSSAAF